METFYNKHNVQEMFLKDNVIIQIKKSYFSLKMKKKKREIHLIMQTENTLMMK